jgi:hypothetical protein
LAHEVLGETSTVLAARVEVDERGQAHIINEQERISQAANDSLHQ